MFNSFNVLLKQNRPQNESGGSNKTTAGASADTGKQASAAQGKDSKTASERPERLELTADEKALIEQGKASVAIVRVLQADGSVKRKQVLVGLNNRVTAQILRGLKEADQIVIADGSDTSNDAAKRSSNRNSGPMRF